jgi:hypothetical protein
MLSVARIILIFYSTTLLVVSANSCVSPKGGTVPSNKQWEIRPLTQSSAFYNEEPTVVHNDQKIYVFWNSGMQDPSESTLMALSFSPDGANQEQHDLSRQSVCKYHYYPGAFAAGRRIWVATMGKICEDADFAIVLREYDPELHLLREKQIVSRKDRIVYDPSMYVDDKFIYVLYVDDRTGHRDVFYTKFERQSLGSLEERQLTQNAQSDATSWVTAFTRAPDGRFYLAYGVADKTGLQSGDIQLELWSQDMRAKLKETRVLGAPIITGPSLYFHENQLFLAYQSLPSKSEDWHIFVRQYDKGLNYIPGTEEQVTQGPGDQRQPWLDVVNNKLILVYDSGQWVFGKSYTLDLSQIYIAERSFE